MFLKVTNYRLFSLSTIFFENTGWGVNNKMLILEKVLLCNLNVYLYFYYFPILQKYPKYIVLYL